MGNNRELSGSGIYHALQCPFPVLDTLINTLARGTSDINALYALFNHIMRQLLHTPFVNFALFIITGIERWDDSLIFLNISHIDNHAPFLMIC